MAKGPGGRPDEATAGYVAQRLIVKLRTVHQEEIRQLQLLLAGHLARLT